MNSKNLRHFKFKLSLFVSALALPLITQPPAAASCSAPAFGPQSTLAVGNTPGSVAVGDFNGDGADLAVANLSDNSISVLLNLNDGSGGFGPQTTFAAGDQPVSVAVGDFNGDGAPDLAVANHSFPDGSRRLTPGWTAEPRRDGMV